MSSCLMVGAVALQLASSGFTLSWTHSVEKVQWQEDWQVSPTGLSLERARIKGSGAGMEPADDAVLKDGWWQWDGHVQTPELNLAASGATVSGWSLCTGGHCTTLATQEGDPVRIAPCNSDAKVAN